MQHTEEAFDDLDRPYIVFSLGGRDNVYNVYNVHELMRPPVEVRRNPLTMAGITLDKLSRIVEKAPDLSGAQSVVQSLEAGILAATTVLCTPGTEACADSE